MKTKIFPCTGCGCCCKRVGLIKLLLYEEDFPFNVDENGACEKLIDNKCSVYNDRPDVCSVYKMALKSSIPIDEYYNLSIKICNDIMDNDNLPLNFRINGL
jgi:Fe-S-cluster containining protein